MTLRTAAAKDYERVFSGREGAVAIDGACVLIVHLEAPTLPIVSAMGRAYAKAAALDQKIAHLCLIEHAAGLLPPGEARDAIGSLMQRFDKRLAAAALVYEAQGFKATVVRSVATGLAMASRITHPMRVFAELPAACSWVAERVMPSSEARLFDIVSQLRAAPAPP